MLARTKEPSYPDASCAEIGIVTSVSEHYDDSVVEVNTYTRVREASENGYPS